MRAKSTNTTLLILTILLCLLVLGLGAYTYSFYSELQENESQLIKDKQLIEQELEQEIVRYTTLLEKNNALSLEMSIAKERLEAFKKRIDSSEVTRSIVQQYQMELSKLRKERELFFRQNDSLKQETRRLSDLQERTQSSLDSLTRQREKISAPALTQETPAILKKPFITISNMQIYGVIQRNSGKFVNTTRAARAQMIRVCYKVDANEHITASELTFYVRVVNQENKLVGIERSVILDTGEQLSYNTQTSIQYKNQSYKVCELVLPVRPFSKGDYKIEIYGNQGLITSADLSLK